MCNFKIVDDLGVRDSEMLKSSLHHEIFMHIRWEIHLTGKTWKDQECVNYARKVWY